MKDIIQLLPDAVANQIAAGEVIQRPASLIKELVENAIDANSTEIKVIVKEAGKTLVQVIDNGCGMSETDARLSFERHATSKIRQAADLFQISTMGFRGEALASIAAVAQVEMKTRRPEDDLGTRIIIKDSKVESQEACQMPVGTSFSVKNLFYNVPARRNFLKSDSVEFKHIVSEFVHIALAHPDVFFSLHHNGKEIYHLPSSNIRQRVVAILGSSFNEKIVPVNEITDSMSISGFVGKPEFSRKRRGSQYIFVNNRFIKSHYLNHAVKGAFEELIPDDAYPTYVLFIEMDPKRLDINVHPTKQEVKFEDERIIYNYVKVAVRHAIGVHSLSPMLDFDTEKGISFDKTPTPTHSSAQSKYQDIADSHSKDNKANWEKLYSGLDKLLPILDPEGVHIQVEHMDEGENAAQQSMLQTDSFITKKSGASESTDRKPFQLQATFIVNQIKSGVLLIHQRRAHERILYEKYLMSFEGGEVMTQKELFPHNLSLNTEDALLMQEILPDIQLLGFSLEPFGTNTFVIQGIPADMVGKNPIDSLEKLLFQYKHNLELNLEHKENIAQSMASSSAIKTGQVLNTEEMSELVDLLFACQIPTHSPNGKPIMLKWSIDELMNQLDR